jgi:hypothetical protein
VSVPLRELLCDNFFVPVVKPVAVRVSAPILVPTPIAILVAVKFSVYYWDIFLISLVHLTLTHLKLPLDCKFDQFENFEFVIACRYCRIVSFLPEVCTCICLNCITVLILQACGHV